MKKFFEKVKDYCIKDTNRMILLVAVLIAVYVVLNLWMQTINLAQIDLTKDRLHSLTDQSKNIAKAVDKEMTFYVWRYSEESTLVDLLKQYNIENPKIKYKIVNIDDIEIIEKFGFESDYPATIGESEDGKISYINDFEFYTYNENFDFVDLTEQKLTNAINNLSNSEITKIYFLQGKTNYTLENGMNGLNSYLLDEYYDVGTIDIIANPTIPEDCGVLAIMGLNTDLSVVEADNICSYIEKGGDLIITNDIDFVNVNRDYPNFQRVLDEYAISMPNKAVMETKTNTVAGLDETFIQSNISLEHEITRLLYNYNKRPILNASGIIELDTEKMLINNITATPILTSSDSATLLDIAAKKVKESDGSNYVLGAAIQKMTESGEESRLVVFASALSFSDSWIENQTTMFAWNGDVMLNSFAFASNRGELYSIRKTSAITRYKPTENQDLVVRMIICALPISIAVLGVCVWVKRRKLK